jgi:hypothetical protein
MPYHSVTDTELINSLVHFWIGSLLELVFNLIVEVLKGSGMYPYIFFSDQDPRILNHFLITNPGGQSITDPDGCAHWK